MFGGKRGIGAEAVLVAADQAMYRAKEEGRNQIALFQDPDEPRRRSRRAQTTSARIRDALTHDRLSLHTQPIRSLASGGIERYELLLRMTGDNGQLLPAASFIEIAERSGMIQELDRWVVARALELLAGRERAGSPVSLHVNLSGASITDISVLEFIERRLDEGGADPSRFTFEITETARVDDYEAAAGFADRLTEFGCQVAIDDYGAGFGPFHYLKQIPFDVIKIDGSFIRDMPQQRRRPADRAGDRRDRPWARQGDDRRVRPGRRHHADAARVRRRHGPGLPPRTAGRRRRGAGRLDIQPTGRKYAYMVGFRPIGWIYAAVRSRAKASNASR